MLGFRPQCSAAPLNAQDRVTPADLFREIPSDPETAASRSFLSPARSASSHTQAPKRPVTNFAHDVKERRVEKNFRVSRPTRLSLSCSPCATAIRRLGHSLSSEYRIRQKAILIARSGSLGLHGFITLEFLPGNVGRGNGLGKEPALRIRDVFCRQDFWGSNSVSTSEKSRGVLRQPRRGRFRPRQLRAGDCGLRRSDSLEPEIRRCVQQPGLLLCGQGRTSTRPSPTSAKRSDSTRRRLASTTTAAKSL